ncbi:MAG: exodeoxyribonuclease III [Sphingopyxis sp.]
MTSRLRIASWNINSVRARAAIVGQFLDDASPDVLCLQETKVEDHAFPHDLFTQRGYDHIVINGQKMHHGVAIISRVPITDVVRHDWQANGEARHLGVSLPGGVRLDNVYIPAGGDVPDREENAKFGQKLDFIERMIGWAGALDGPTILTGDFNIAPLDSDVWSHKSLLKTVSHTPIEVAALARLQAAADWVDLGRHFMPAPARLYTWWSYRAADWTVGDRGRRLDHMWATPDVAAKAVAHRIHEHCRSWEKPSDHIPIVTDFAM